MLLHGVSLEACKSRQACLQTPSLAREDWLADQPHGGPPAPRCANKLARGSVGVDAPGKRMPSGASVGFSHGFSLLPVHSEVVAPHRAEEVAEADSCLYSGEYLCPG